MKSAFLTLALAGTLLSAPAIADTSGLKIAFSNN